LIDLDFESFQLAERYADVTLLITQLMNSTLGLASAAVGELLYQSCDDWCLCRRAFDEAVKRLSRVGDANISQMLGVIRQRAPLAIVMEYLPHGNLHQFLQQRVFDDGSERTRRDGPPSLR